MFLRYCLIVLLLAGHSLAGAQPQSGSARPAELGELYYQLQLLQQEIMQLRGLVEEQGNQLRKLQQQRLDDYMNLDRRLGELSATAPAAATGAARPAVVPPAAAVPATPPAPVRPAAAGLTETDAYQQAFARLKARQTGEAIQAFQGFLQDFPRSDLVPDAHYWLGRLYRQESRLDDARLQFQKVVDDYPQDDKVADALFNLGQTHRLLGNADKAKTLLRQVLARFPGTNAAAQAKTELDTQF